MLNRSCFASALAVSAVSMGCGHDGANAPAVTSDGGNDATVSPGGPSRPGQEAGVGAEGGRILAPDASTTGDSGDSLASAFVFVGGCRLDNNDLDPTNDPSSANLAQLTETLADIAAMADRPRYFFFVGDMVDALASGSTTLSTQLNAWAQIFGASPTVSKLTLVPVVGNHEVLYSKNGVEQSNQAADGVWTQWILANKFDTHAGNGPTTAGPNSDALQDDQSRLSYSFDDGGAHLVVLNTDTWTTTPDSSTGVTALGWVPLQWLTADIQAAQANPSVTGIYVFGHKPLVDPSGSTASTEAINPALAPAMMRLLDANSKVRGYFTSHAHMWKKSQLPGTRGVWQIVVGNGGSPIDSSWTEPNPYYGFTEVRIYVSGRVGVVSYQRPVPHPYNAATTVAATPQPEFTIFP